MKNDKVKGVLVRNAMNRSYLELIFMSIFFPSRITSGIDEKVKSKMEAVRNITTRDVEKEYRQEFQKFLKSTEKRQYLENAVVNPEHVTPMMTVPVLDNDMNYMDPAATISINNRDVEQIRCSLERLPHYRIEQEASMILARTLIERGFMTCDMTIRRGYATYSINTIG